MVFGFEGSFYEMKIHFEICVFNSFEDAKPGRIKHMLNIQINYYRTLENCFLRLYTLTWEAITWKFNEQ